MGKENKVKSKNNKTLIYFGGAIILVIIVIVLIFITNKKPNSSREQDLICGDDIIKQHKDIINGQFSELSQSLIKLGHQIKKKEGFEKEANCLYLVARGAMEEHSWSEAHQQILRLKDKYLAGDKVSSKLTSLTPEQLEKYLNHLMLSNAKGE